MNALAVAVRRKRIGAEQASSFLVLLAQFDFRFAPVPNAVEFPRLSSLAARHHLTAYDTAYLDLAMRLALPLATLDADLRSAALSEGVKLC